MVEFFQYPFLVRALIGAVILGLLSAVLGVFVVLRRMAFFGDAIAHSSLAGIALGLALGIDPLAGSIGFSVLVALGIARVYRNRSLSFDTVIGVFFAMAVSLGVIVISGLRSVRVDLLGFLFGDILAISVLDLWIIGTVAFLVLIAVVAAVKPLIQVAFQPDLARVSGVPVELVDYLFLVVLALTVAIGIKVAGVILMGPLLIIPAAAAKNVATNFRSMILLAMVISFVATVGGLATSYSLNIPTGPTIILASCAIFFFTLFLQPTRT